MAATRKTMSYLTWTPWLLGLAVSLVLAGTTQGDAPLLDPNELAKIGLRIAWQRPLPLHDGETIEQFVMRNDRLYLLTDTNYAISLRRDDGSTIFMRRMAPRGFEVNGWQLRDDLLFSAIGEVVTLIGSDTGTVLGAKAFGFNLTDAPVRDHDGIYLASTHHRVHTIGREDHVEHYSVSAPSGAPVTAIALGGGGLILATAAGEVMSLATGNQPFIRWQFQARDAVVAPLVVDGDSLYFASRDTYVYRLNLNPQAKRLVWRTQCEALLDIAPRVTKNVIYQPMKQAGITAIDKATGATLWTQTGARELLAQSGPWAYLWTTDRKIVVMDNEKARWAHMLDAPGLVYPCTNTADAEIYLADDQGRIVCLIPTTTRLP